MSETDEREYLSFIKENSLSEILNYSKKNSVNVWKVFEKDPPLASYSSLHILASKEHNSALIDFISALKLREDFTPQRLKTFINLKNNAGYTALHFLAFSGFIEGIKVLIENGADIDERNNHGLNVLHIAAQNDQSSVIVFFKEKYNLDLNSLDISDSTPLHWACFSLSDESITFLLALGANINAQDKDGLTALHVAITSVTQDRAAIVLKLILQGADKNIMNKEGKSAIDYALSMKKNFVIKYLEDKPNPSAMCDESPNKKMERNHKNVILFIASHLILTICVYLAMKGDITNWFSFNYLMLFASEFIVFIYLVFADPGIIAKSNTSLLNVVESNKQVSNFCPWCVAEKEPKSKHCLICDKCISHFDHHCFWVNNCVGKNNKTPFLVFVFLESLYLLANLFFGLYDMAINFKFRSLKDAFLRQAFCAFLVVFSVCLVYPVFCIFLTGLRVNEKPIKEASKKAKKEIEFVK